MQHTASVLNGLAPGNPLPFKHDQNYYYNLFRFVCGKNPPPANASMIVSLVNFRLAFPVALDSTNLMVALSQLAREFVQNLHLPISREDFHSLLRRCNYPNLPTQQVFLANDILAAQIYWDVLDFRKMKFANVAEFRGQMRCFDFLLASDGYAFTAHFTRPSYAAGVEIRPQDIVPNAGDEVFFVDPGQKMSFTAMKGLGSADNPSPIIKLSTVEYYTMAGLNRTSKYRLDQKILDADRFGAANSVQRIESEMPTSKTVNVASIAAFLAYNALHYQRLADFYDEKFNRWRMWNYSGKQKAESEARKLKKTIYCNANFYL